MPKDINFTEDSLAEHLIDELYAGEPNHSPEFRINHAKGILLQGQFIPTENARNISTAYHFNHVVPITVRLSNSTGIADIAENNRHSSPKGIAIRFQLPNEYSDLIGHSVEAFPADTPEEFIQFLEAINQLNSAPDVLDAYLKSNKAADHFLSEIGKISSSFAKFTFYPLHAYKFTNIDQQVVIGRYQIQSVLKMDDLDDAALENKSKNFLTDELIERIKQSNVKYNLLLQRANPSDNVMKISQPWQGEHQIINLGELVLETIVDHYQDVEKDILFDPTHLTQGIEGVGDPMFKVRSPAYHKSYHQRHK